MCLINAVTEDCISVHAGLLIAPFHRLFYKIKPDVKLQFMGYDTCLCLRLLGKRMNGVERIKLTLLLPVLRQHNWCDFNCFWRARAGCNRKSLCWVCTTLAGRFKAFEPKRNHTWMAYIFPFNQNHICLHLPNNSRWQSYQHRKTKPSHKDSDQCATAVQLNILQTWHNEHGHIVLNKSYL